MPRKTRRGRLFQSKKGKGRRGSSPMAVQQQAVAQTSEPLPPPKVAAPSTSIPTRRAPVTVVQYPHIATELQRIGIMAGIVLVILVVLFLFLP